MWQRCVASLPSRDRKNAELLTPKNKHRIVPSHIQHTAQLVQTISKINSITSGGLRAQRFMFFHEQELDLENVVSSTPVQPPGTLFHPTFMTLLIPVHSENDSRVYFLIVLFTDYCWRSWTCRISAPYRSHVYWFIDWLTKE